MSSTEPTRPFESLEWYSRQVRQHEGARGGWVRWLGGIGFLSLHISIFALGMIVMFSINLLENPAEIWVDRVLWAWTILIVVHLLVIGLTVAIGLLRDDDDAALEIVKDVGWRQAATWPGGQQPVADFRVTSPPHTPEQGPPAEAEPSAAGHHVSHTAEAPPGWQGWQAGPGSPNAAPAASVGNPSWKEATSWISRRRRENRGPDDRSST